MASVGSPVMPVFHRALAGDHVESLVVGSSTTCSKLVAFGTADGVRNRSSRMRSWACAQAGESFEMRAHRIWSLAV